MPKFGTFSEVETPLYLEISFNRNEPHPSFIFHYPHSIGQLACVVLFSAGQSLVILRLLRLLVGGLIPDIRGKECVGDRLINISAKDGPVGWSQYGVYVLLTEIRGKVAL